LDRIKVEHGSNKDDRTCLYDEYTLGNHIYFEGHGYELGVELDKIKEEKQKKRIVNQ